MMEFFVSFKLELSCQLQGALLNDIIWCMTTEQLVDELANMEAHCGAQVCYIFCYQIIFYDYVQHSLVRH